jgi:hypothetical protein
MNPYRRDRVWTGAARFEEPRTPTYRRGSDHFPPWRIEEWMYALMCVGGLQLSRSHPPTDL